ncbi:hypothetical protein FRB90_009420 [Tulasnella sp. 427]|nr:hypothetical protein FRB90_009420 [Tulasnella sp. 427]
MPIQSRIENENVDAINNLLTHCRHVTTEARFLRDSLPNVDLPAARRAVTLLQAITNALETLDNPWLNPEDILSAQQEVLESLIPLEEFINNQAEVNQPRHRRVVYSGNPGRPPLDLDLDHAQELHDLGNSWDSVARALGTVRSVLMDHMKKAGRVSERPAFTEITDDDLNETIAEIILAHPFIGGAIVHGHLESQGVHVPRRRVTESLQRIDSVGVLIRWAGIIKRRVYKVRGANALWHHDGNEKLRPWGFYVYGCVDGFSRLIIYLVCCNNKRASTVEEMFVEGVNTYGWPSRVRGDYGTENNGVERRMNEHWDLFRTFVLKDFGVIEFRPLWIEPEMPGITTRFGRQKPKHQSQCLSCQEQQLLPRDTGPAIQETRLKMWRILCMAAMVMQDFQSPKTTHPRQIWSMKKIL